MLVAPKYDKNGKISRRMRHETTSQYQARQAADLERGTEIIPHPTTFNIGEYNNTINPISGRTPNQMMFGAHTPSTHNASTSSTDNTSSSPMDDESSPSSHTHNHVSEHDDE